MENREIEAKFLEVDKEVLIAKLRSLGAEDLGEDFLREIIFYDKDKNWLKEGKQFIRIRETKNGALLTYKHHQHATAAGTEEIEFKIDNTQKATDFLIALGLVRVRNNEKRRHTFKFQGATVDIDTWPKVPTYVEIEGPSESNIREVSEKLGFDWSKAVFDNAMRTIEKYYNIPIRTLKYFTFDRVE